MYSITPWTEQRSDLKLGPVPKARVEIDGEMVDALLDTGSPVTIVALEFLLQVWAKKKPSEHSPQDWKAEVE